MKIPLCIPYVGPAEENALLEVLRSGWYAHGPKNKEFEAGFASLLGVRHAISMNSCASALEVALLAQDIRGEVILPSFTFVASANAVVTAGATPVFADIDVNTHNLNAASLVAAVTDATEAIMPVHVGGLVCNMTEIMCVADRYGLAVVEDSAETIGGKHNDRLGGSFGTGCFSFFPTKNLTTGEGGMLTTNDDALAEKARAMIGHGISKTTLDREKAREPWERVAVLPGHNFRMSNLLAALGVEQLRKLSEMNDKRREAAALLVSHLADIEGLELPYEGDQDYHVYQMFLVKLREAEKRSPFVHFLREQDIGASVHFSPPVHAQPPYVSARHGTPLDVTEDVASRIVTLPLYPGMGADEIEYVADAVHRFFR